MSGGMYTGGQTGIGSQYFNGNNLYNGGAYTTTANNVVNNMIYTVYTTNSSTTTAVPVMWSGGGNMVTIVPQQGISGGVSVYSDKDSLESIMRVYNGRVVMSDGSILELDGQGGWTILDQDSRIKYKGCEIREFNRFVNASDLLEKFVEECGRLGVKQKEFMNLPLHLFINWLILQAAEADNIPPPPVPRLKQQIQLALPAPPRDDKQLAFIFMAPKIGARLDE